MLKEIDIWDVACVMAKNDYTPGTEAHEVMCDRYTKFDDMSLDYVKQLSRRALQALERHLLDGVVVGNVDLDSMLVEQLDLPLEDASSLQQVESADNSTDAERNADSEVDTVTVIWYVTVCKGNRRSPTLLPLNETMKIWRVWV
jgi:hypothetical protein